MPIKDLRSLRREAEELNATVAEDLQPFLHQKNHQTFRRVPTDSSSKKLNVTSTCTGLMTLASANELPTFYGSPRKSWKGETQAALTKVIQYKWESSGLEEANAFTSALVLRATGVLVDRGVLPRETATALSHDGRRLSRIAKEFATEVPASLSIQNYPPAPTIVYWFVDAAHNLQLQLPPGSWKRLADWAAREFSRQMSMVAAPNEAMMDPIAMAMAACLVARIRRISNEPGFPDRSAVLGELPSEVELVAAVRSLFQHQGKSGIWPKYFPLFHYPEAGANHTFSFELLEAILKEFDASVVARSPEVLQGLQRAVEWCRANRLAYFDGTQTYHGWNSGGEVLSLRRGVPESWATGVVHMFLRKLREQLSAAIEEGLLSAYSSRAKGGEWDLLIDTPVTIAGDRTTLKEVLRADILDRVDHEAPKHAKINHARSALLFGPPGTSKTSIVRALAGQIGWRYIEINPSHFLADGLNAIYTRANGIFDDLQDLSKVVILFDEMDALVQRRSGTGVVERLDVTREFLTTSMLPKLSDLHDRGQVLFFMATNHQAAFDEAIKRPGRFDLLLHVAPPRWRQKLKSFNRLWVGEGTADDRTAVQVALAKWISHNDKLRPDLDLFTYGEMKSFLVAFKKNASLRAAVEAPGAQERFRTLVREWTRRFITLREGQKAGSPRDEFEVDREASFKQWS